MINLKNNRIIFHRYDEKNDKKSLSVCFLPSKESGNLFLKTFSSFEIFLKEFPAEELLKKTRNLKVFLEKNKKLIDLILEADFLSVQKKLSFLEDMLKNF